MQHRRRPALQPPLPPVDAYTQTAPARQLLQLPAGAAPALSRGRGRARGRQRSRVDLFELGQPLQDDLHRATAATRAIGRRLFPADACCLRLLPMHPWGTPSVGQGSGWPCDAPAPPAVAPSAAAAPCLAAAAACCGSGRSPSPCSPARSLAAPQLLPQLRQRTCRVRGARPTFLLVSSISPAMMNSSRIRYTCAHPRKQTGDTHPRQLCARRRPHSLRLLAPPPGPCLQRPHRQPCIARARARAASPLPAAPPCGS